MENSPIEEVALTVPITDDPSMPVWTFRMWFLGIIWCAVLAFVNQFFFFRTAPLSISALTAQVCEVIGACAVKMSHCGDPLHYKQEIRCSVKTPFLVNLSNETGPQNSTSLTLA